MNSLVFLPLMAAMVLAAPGGVHHQLPGGTGPLAVASPVYGYSGLTYAASPVAYTSPVVHAPVAVAPVAVAPVVQHVSVPITKTVHYETKPVVTGYSQQIIKPAIPFGFNHPTLQAVSVQQHVVAPQVAQVAVSSPVAIAPAPAVAVGDAEIIEARSVPVASPAQPVVSAAVAVQPAVAVHSTQPFVTKEAVLAPVRTHTQIIPQITQVQPEVHVRKVIQNVDVHTPVAVQTPVQVRVNQPILSAPALHTTNHVITGHSVFGHAGHQFVF